MSKNDHYTYRVTWSEEDQEYVALCLEFPSLSFLAQTQAAALKGIVNLIKETIIDMKENNELIPEPIAEKHYSGKFMVRILPAQHRMLAIEAAEEKVSLNRYIASKLVSS